MKTAHVEVRSQSPKGSFPHAGPDTYVMVQVVPDGIEPLVCLNRKAAEKRGIELIYCGEGYSNRQKTPRSMLNQAVANAEVIADEINTLVEYEEALYDDPREAFPEELSMIGD